MKWTSAKVRDSFIQYFVRNKAYPHSFVPSSSIVPKKDPTLAFVNAGMNQFKDAILGYGRPQYPRATNSQKCLRINDLHLVGADTYHHTFFEMLGNWSFSNYFKKEACAMAWDLLTKEYGVDPGRLYVTYYAGGGSVPMDKETKMIWESIGVKPDRILPFGKENFWQMGPIGPCGPSTEIHYDHRGSNLAPSNEINGDSGLVVEVWNLVFMQYNKTQNGELERLPLSHVVDTGAGLERLCAVLNKKTSNYDTDLFQPIFGKVKELSKGLEYGGSFAKDAERDTCYRIFADHMRAVTLALSDGILPQTNHKIRKLIQRSLAVSDQQFNTSSLSSADRLQFLLEGGVNPVEKSLGKVFVEISSMKPEISKILESEIERYSELAVKSKAAASSSAKLGIPSVLLFDFPSLSRLSPEDIGKVKELGGVDGQTAYRWYDSCGVSVDAIEDLCSALGLTFNKAEMDQEMKRVKKQFRDEVTAEMIVNEERLFVRRLESLMALYDPKDSGGICNPTINLANEPRPGVFVEWIFDANGDPVEEISNGDNESHWLILNKTPFVPGSESFQSDSGIIVLDNGCKLKVDQVRRLPSGWLLHLVKNVPEIGLGRKAVLKKYEINNNVRFGREMSAKAIGYINWWLKERFKVIRVENEVAHNKTCQLRVTILENQGDLSLQDIHQMQHDLNEHGVPVVVINKSNTSKKAGVHDLTVATGLSAEVSMRYGQEILDCLGEIQELCKECKQVGGDESSEKTKQVLKILVDRTKECLQRPELLLPFEVHQESDIVLRDADKILWKSQEQLEISKMIHEIASDCTKDSKVNYLIKLFSSDHEFTSLKKITRVAEQQNTPILVLIRSSDDYIHGRCSVPKGLPGQEVGSRISAEDWMKCVTAELGKGVVAAPKGQDGNFQVNLKKIRIYDCHERLAQGLEKARKYIDEKIHKKFIECGGDLDKSLSGASSNNSNSSKSDSESVRLQ